MQITWELCGAKWTSSLLLEDSIEPIEAATLCLENALLENNELDLGIVLILKNSKMTSDGQHLLFMTSLVLANAGFYSLASELESELNKTLRGQP